MELSTSSESSPGSGALSEALSLAMDQEFPAWGILCDPGPAPEWPFFQEWLREGFHGKLDYMARSANRRQGLSQGYPGMCTLVIGLLFHNFGSPEKKQSVNIVSHERFAKIARYAVGPDYHRLFDEAFGRVITAIRPFLPATEKPLIKVDHGALFEKSLARRAGLGAIGKNTLLIRPGHGSYFTLGSLLLSTPLPSRIDAYGATEICGGCTRCLDACPTGALVEPYRLDSRRCLSYLTIERPSDDSLELRKKFGGEWLFGCDICQEVCPYNAIPPLPETENAGRLLPVTASSQELKGFRRRNGALSRISLTRLDHRLREIRENESPED
ncbi:MAG: tRNA epoxyqueuosine(34) reductase QueG [Leptospirillia bacterium]